MEHLRHPKVTKNPSICVIKQRKLHGKRLLQIYPVLSKPVLAFVNIATDVFVIVITYISRSRLAFGEHAYL